MASKIDFRQLADPISSRASSRVSIDKGKAAEVVHRQDVVPKITAAVVDEAVEEVLSGLNFPDTEKEVIRNLLATDPDTEFANGLHATRIDDRGAGTFGRLKRPSVNVPYLMSPEETADLVSYAPEFDLKFLDKENHDHPMAAAMRRIDSEIIKMSLPKDLPIKDIGGDPIQLINDAAVNVHACNPDADLKDSSRGTFRRLRAMKVARDESRSDVVRELARRYLASDQSFVCSKRGQDCDHQARVTRSVHVYDVPMEDWPAIMQRAGASMHLGVILFPMAAYGVIEGELPKARARYKIDVAQNKFRMGFVNSAAWFYSHDWLQFMRYGVDQIIETEYGRYSYKVTQRRGDTLFFQILRVDTGMLPVKQYYSLPTIPMVRVEGFEYVAGKAINSIVGRSPLSPKVHWFPQRLWMDMLQQAKMDFERGVFSFDKLYNYYRVVSPRNTINGVLISGGERVPHDQMVALITHAGMCAASEVMLGQRTSRAMTDYVQRSRARLDDGLAKRLLKGFWDAVQSTTMGGPMAAISWLCDKVRLSIDKSLDKALVSWHFEPQIREVQFLELAGSTYVQKHASWNVRRDSAEEMLRQYMLLHENTDHRRALLAVSELSAEVQDMVSDVTGESRESTTVVPTLVHGESEEVVEDIKISPEVVAMRRAAIQECIDESILEENKNRELCAKAYSACMDPRREPILNMLASRAEEYGQPDFWWVNNGVLVRSALGLTALECNYSALYTPSVDETTQSNFRTVVDDQYVGEYGQPVKQYKRFVVGRYTGWALSIDRLLVYNGPEIRNTLKLAISMQHDYVVELHQGPPGCGKTRELVLGMRINDVAMCPVRESAEDTRARLCKKFGAGFNGRAQSPTVDSYLTNYLLRSNQALRADILRADECFMTPSGKWYASAALLASRRVVAFGDVNQIPHIPRVQAAGLYTRLVANKTVTSYTTYRCPADAVAAWAEIYDYRVRTYSTVMRSLSVATDHTQVPLKTGCVLMVMYQAGKKELRRMFSGSMKANKLKIMTAHESEGKTFKDVMLFRFDTRVRNDKISLFDQKPHVLVAMSRHTDSFVYVRAKSLGDLVDQWIEKSTNVRAVAAAADIASVGTRMEFK